MCGICGAFRLDGARLEAVPRASLDAMNEAMEHRGPNDAGTYAVDRASLGARRLSIVDVEGGHQPFANEDRSIWAVQNGELYNHDVLRKQLEGEGHRFRSRCDTEVIPHVYERWGVRFAEQLRGKFAIAVWDEREGRGVLARDRLGIKPLYYAVVDERVLFASELKSLLASGLVDATLDYEAIDAFLTLGFFPTPATPLAGVSKLPPGHRLIVDDSGIRIEQYWAYPEPVLRGPWLREQDYREQLLAELDESVRLRLMSDVPLGAMLSGGLDSSLIVALMARHMSEPVKTFSVGFREDTGGNELGDARLVANALGADHHELELSFSEQEVDIAELVWHLDEPLADLSSLGFLALSGLAAQHVTVALSGQGADELLGGYRKHRAASIASAWRRLPAPLRSVALAAARRGPARLARPVRTLEAGDATTRLLAMTGHVHDDLRPRLVRGPLAELDGLAARRAVEACMNGFPDDPLPATMYLDGQLSLVDDMIHYFDRASMAHSLEVRVPFLDHHVVEYCATIPSSLKVRRLRTKHLLKEAARGLIPDQIIDKKKIGFFNAAVDGWFRTQMRGPLGDYLLDSRPRYGEIVDRGTVAGLVRAHVDGTNTRHADLLLSLLMLEVWLATYLPRATALPAPARERIAVGL